MKNILAFAATLCVVYITASSSYGQTQLPQPDPAFKGRIGETYKDSTPSFPMPVKAAKGSPNVLLILLDDVGKLRDVLYVRWSRTDSTPGQTR